MEKELSKATKRRIEKQSYVECTYAPHRAGYLLGATTESLRSQQLVEALEEFISMHETGLLPNRFTYEDAKKALHQYNNLK